MPGSRRRDGIAARRRERRRRSALALSCVLLIGCKRSDPALSTPPNEPGRAAAKVPPRPLLSEGFEGAALADFWLPGDYGSGRYAAGAVALSTDHVRSGKASVRITVREGDVAQSGDSGQRNERAELDSGKHPFAGREIWYRYSFLVPDGFPVVNTRLVISQWKQSRTPGSPLIAQRYVAGMHYLTVRDWAAPGGPPRIYPLPPILHERWNDAVCRVRFSPDPDGEVEFWLNGAKVVAHHGPTTPRGGRNSIYHKIGLYRDRWPEPMTLYFDDYAIGESLAAVSATPDPGP